MRPLVDRMDTHSVGDPSSSHLRRVTLSRTSNLLNTTPVKPRCRAALSDLLQCGSSDNGIVGKCYFIFILQRCYGQVANVAPET
jgi:hypothetical protein